MVVGVCVWFFFFSRALPPGARTHRSSSHPCQPPPTHTHTNKQQTTNKVEELPDSVAQLVVGLTVPIVYPHLVGGEPMLETFGRLNKLKPFKALFKATGIGKLLFNEVGEAELLDDLRFVCVACWWAGVERGKMRRRRRRHTHSLSLSFSLSHTRTRAHNNNNTITPRHHQGTTGARARTATSAASWSSTCRCWPRARACA